MEEITNLKFYNLILVRYSGEIWLKSRKVKIRMLKVLMDNIKTLLTRSGIIFHKYQLSKDSARIFYFFNNKDIPQAINILKNVFGIYSFSPALRTSNKIKNMIERTIEVAREVLQEGDEFALRVKRSGRHDYSSHDVAVKVGQAIIDNFSELKLKVNLSNPKKKIFIEIRDEFSYVYTNIIKSKFGGLPIESRKKILAMDVGRIEDILAAFLLMRRGSELYPILFDLNDNDNLFETRLSNWKEVVKYTPHIRFLVIKVNLVKILAKVIQDMDDKKYICAICKLVRFDILSKILKELDIKNFDRIRAISDGVSLTRSSLCPDDVDLESIALNYFFSEYPIFTPVIGLDSKDVEDFISKISSELKSLDYCRFKPKNQEINIEELKTLYNSLNLNDLIRECLNSIEKIKIS